MDWNFRGFGIIDLWLTACTHFFTGCDFIVMAETAEQISQRPEIRKELERTTGEKRPEKIRARARDKFWFVIHGFVLAACVAAYFVLSWKLVPLPQATLGLVGRMVRGAALIVVVLTVARIISVYALGRIEDSSTRFTLHRVLHLNKWKVIPFHQVKSNSV